MGGFVVGFSGSIAMPRSKSLRPQSRPFSAPATVNRPPPPPPALVQQQQPGMMRGIGSTIAEGMAFGGGSAVAHRAVDSMMGPRVVHHEHAQANQSSTTTTAGGSQEAGVCVNQVKAFQDCLTANVNDISKCQFYVDMLNECRKSAVEASQSPGW